MQINILLKRLSLFYGQQRARKQKQLPLRTTEFDIDGYSHAYNERSSGYRKICAIAASLSIIAMTANAFLVEEQQALAAGCNDVIS